MSGQPAFRDPEKAHAALGRIGELCELEPSEALSSLLTANVDPDRALGNLEAWLKSAANPAAQLQGLLDSPGLGRLLLQLMGASQPLANALIQNPELASLLTDPTALTQDPSTEIIEADGESLLESATSYSHALDRLRYLRHRWLLPIVLHDLAGTMPQEQVWLGLSNLADALIRLALRTAWRDYAVQKGLEGACPVAIVAFGKLGGQELNYSSDVDLVYVADRALAEQEEKHATRFCEVFGRALSDKMGRGSLYRVDLRLRPFGGAGPVLQTRRAVEAYYRSHAHLWECQALLRSRVIAGSEDSADWWERLRLEHCFRPLWSTHALEEILDMRARTEDFGGEDDLKRGYGGIRDVEFLTQVLQMIHGAKAANLREPNTLSALAGLRSHGLISEEDGQSLAEAYRLLRKSEHRCQLAEDQHTHSLPADEEGRARLAKLMGFSEWTPYAEALAATRNQVREIYDARFPRSVVDDDRLTVLASLGEAASTAEVWFDDLPECEAFYKSLHENRDSLERVRKIAEIAPVLSEVLAKDVSLTEEVLSGEVLEPWEPGRKIAELPPDATDERYALAIRSEWTKAAIQWMFEPSSELGQAIQRIGDAVLRSAMERVGAEFDVVALGSYASGELGLGSDLDLLWLVDTAERHMGAETQAQKLMLHLDRIKRLGAPVSIDLRLRPEGRQGLLVRTYAGLRAYDLGEMEMWERFALGSARSVCGDPMAEAGALASAYALPLTPERLTELLSMKQRIETERVSIKHRHRHLKLGRGGLSDIEWFVHLHELRYPTTTQAGTRREMPPRIRTLGHAQLINTLEQEALLEARKHLLATRDRLVLLGFTPDIVPENPDKLDILARAAGFVDGNEFLAIHEDMTHSVRSIYEEGIDRLQN
ncbi:MAG: hypothetical protein HZC36_16825 [Armatimonadetes bacterium]|nr:hypothetical protein [Armatimonadota bacterium]